MIDQLWNGVSPDETRPIRDEVAQLTRVGRKFRAFRDKVSGHEFTRECLDRWWTLRKEQTADRLVASVASLLPGAAPEEVAEFVECEFMAKIDP